MDRIFRARLNARKDDALRLMGARTVALAADRKELHLSAVDADIKALTAVVADGTGVTERSAEPYFHDILAVNRKVVPDHGAAARPERQVDAHATILRRGRRQTVRRDYGPCGWISD